MKSIKQNRHHSAVMLLTMLLALAMPFQGWADSGVRGDVNDDSIVNMDDLSALINYLVTNDASIISISGADTDNNGTVGMDDLSVLINFLVNGEWPSSFHTYIVNGVEFVMVPVEGGTFMMGATLEQGNDASSREKPVHQVTLDNFLIGQTEVTHELWMAVMGNNPSYFNGSQLPVEQVTWEDCQVFIAALNEITNQNFRLPTEAEWEFAARGGNDSQGYKYAGGNTLSEVAWYSFNDSWESRGSGYYGTHAVATREPNELQLYDMSGNVHEWCQDWYGNYSNDEQINPVGPTSGTKRVYRGGNWYFDDWFCRVSFRNGLSPTSSNYGIGLRLAK